MHEFYLEKLFDNAHPLNDRLSYLHDTLLEKVPQLERIACAIYQRESDTLRTFINSTKSGNTIQCYEAKLSDSQSLSKLAHDGGYRLITNLQESIHPTSTHSKWLLEQGYVSSLTIPIYSSGSFFGFIFFDASSPDAFDDKAQRDLLLYSNFIVMTVTSEITMMKVLAATARSSIGFAELRDFETGKHLERMSFYSRLIARDLAVIHKLSDETIEHIFTFAPLHDIGKIGIPDEILLKAGKLSDDERAYMKKHVNKGVDILNRILEDFQLSHLTDSKIMINMVKYHHEYPDGSGYPGAYKAEQIPIEGRIIAVADIFDALTTVRPYKSAWTIEQALDELNRMVDAGKLDKDCVDALINNIDEVKAIATKFQG